MYHAIGLGLVLVRTWPRFLWSIFKNIIPCTKQPQSVSQLLCVDSHEESSVNNSFLWSSFNWLMQRLCPNNKVGSRSVPLRNKTQEAKQTLESNKERNQTLFVTHTSSFFQTLDLRSSPFFHWPLSLGLFLSRFDTEWLLHLPLHQLLTQCFSLRSAWISQKSEGHGSSHFLTKWQPQLYLCKSVADYGLVWIMLFFLWLLWTSG